ncbi:MAG: DUF4468 domain-containing protein [Cytophagales bacterium]|nr:MAG: DUF4468 domain-containing protein [Cytophagales bacterium]
MKALTLIIISNLLILLNHQSRAQSLFPIDSASNKIQYSDVVITDSIFAPQLYKNAEKWAALHLKKQSNQQTEFDLKQGFIKCTNSFLVYTKGMMSKEIHGLIDYDVYIEIKDQKYRYTFNNFVFNYYKQNRFYEYVPTGKKKPLEEPKFQGWQPVWNKHKKLTNNIILDQIFKLKNIMKEKELPIIEKKAVKKTDW